MHTMQDLKTSNILKLFIIFPTMLFSSFINGEIDALVFPEIRINSQSENHFSIKNVDPSLDLFVSGELGQMLLLGEVFASEQVQHFERIQVGLKIGNSARAWLGRYHNPFGYWHTQYHHGNFLQTPISRPAIAAFGSAGGVMPSHLTGALYEGTLDQGKSAWKYALGIGWASQVQGFGSSHHGGDFASLHDFEPLRSSSRNHKLGGSFRLAYLPDIFEETQFGGFITRASLTRDNTHMEDEPHEAITLDVFGIFANYQQERFRWVGEAYYIASKVPSYEIPEMGNFLATYIQAEFFYKEYLTPYARIDYSFTDEDDPYLNVLDGFVHEAKTLGLRWDFSATQALKIEYSYRHLAHDKHGQWLLNWTAVWP